MISPISREKKLQWTKVVLAILVLLTVRAEAWWNNEWTVRQKVTMDTTALGTDEAIGTVAVLVRLHDGNYQFAAGKPDGSDLRFVAADDKTLLTHHVERFDSLLNEAYVWVKLPDIKANTQVAFWLYSGNLGDKAVRIDNAKGTYDEASALVFHFSENSGAPVDSSSAGNTADKSGIVVAGGLIGGAIRPSGGITVAASPSLRWKEDASATVTAWIKPSGLRRNAVLLSRREEGSSWVLGLDNGVPYVETNGKSGPQRSAAAPPVAMNAWLHLAMVASPGKVALYLNGESYAVLNTGLPALNAPLLLGKDSIADSENPDAGGFPGELDELQVANVARPLGFLKLSALQQGGNESAGKILVVGASEEAGHGAGGEIMKHLSLFGEISKSLTFDGWIVIGLCTLLAVVGWGVTLSKFMYLKRIKKATAAFLDQWQNISSDLTALDHTDDAAIRSMGGTANSAAQKLMRESPLFHIYHLGSQEISRRMANAKDGFNGLSERSISAIRVSLDGGLFREVQRLNSNIVFLTIGIAGGPYLGLLGTVIGVMITFAVIAQSGQVEINSIAPGIAGALLATVAGLAVAIPALFAYSYISSKIKDAVGEMQNFIDEFVAKIAEFYPSANE